LSGEASPAPEFQMESHMTEPSDHASHAQPESPQAAPRRRRRWPFIAAIVVAAAVTGGIATHAVSQHRFGGYWHGPGFMMGGPFDPARAEERADRMTRHVAIEIDATAEQQEKLRAIVKSAVKDLLPMREKAQAARQRAQALLVQQNVDRAAIEAFRAEQMGLADTASKRIAQAIGDAADVLNYEQRRKLGEHIEALKERRDFWRGWHRG
jgi:Spy/CpxP family protein refolding chaperone